MAKGREGGTYISMNVKHMMFFFIILIWLISAVYVAVGTWVYLEKAWLVQSDLPMKNNYDIIMYVSIVIIIVGCVIFVVTFTGCLGALRENIFLLKLFSCAAGVIFLLEMVGAILALVFSSEVKQEGPEVPMKLVDRYRDDTDYQKLMDWLQETYSCCGIHGYEDWSHNEYFNCSSPSIEACGVPFSCCITSEVIKNTQCGYGVQKLSTEALREKIFTLGCVEAVKAVQAAEDDVVQEKLYIMGGVAIGLAIPQLVGIILAWILAKQIVAEQDMLTRQGTPVVSHEHQRNHPDFQAPSRHEQGSWPAPAAYSLQSPPMSIPDHRPLQEPPIRVWGMTSLYHPHQKVDRDRGHQWRRDNFR